MGLVIGGLIAGAVAMAAFVAIVMVTGADSLSGREVSAALPFTFSALVLLIGGFIFVSSLTSFLLYSAGILTALATAIAVLVAWYLVATQ